jgi:hypothetical protein
MNEIAVASKDTKPTKERRLSRRFRHACEELISGRSKTQTQAASAANMSREHFCKMLKTPHGRAFYERRVKETISASQMPATAALVGLLENGTSEHVVKDCALAILKMNGHVPPEHGSTLVNVEIKAGYVIDLSPDRDPPLLEHGHSQR